MDREQRVVDVGDSNRYGGGDCHRSRGGERCGAPYAIVGGVPAREIRKRFDDEQVAYLLASRWWERPFDELRKEADSFSDIGLFMKNGL